MRHYDGLLSFPRHNFKNGVVYKYVTFDVESEYGIYFYIKTILTQEVFI